jgi:hypothetical protein
LQGLPSDPLQMKTMENGLWLAGSDSGAWFIAAFLRLFMFPTCYQGHLVNGDFKPKIPVQPSPWAQHSLRTEEVRGGSEADAQQEDRRGPKEILWNSEVLTMAPEEGLEFGWASLTGLVHVEKDGLGNSGRMNEEGWHGEDLPLREEIRCARRRLGFKDGLRVGERRNGVEEAAIFVAFDGQRTRRLPDVAAGAIGPIFIPGDAEINPHPGRVGFDLHNARVLGRSVGRGLIGVTALAERKGKDCPQSLYVVLRFHFALVFPVSFIFKILSVLGVLGGALKGVQCGQRKDRRHNIHGFHLALPFQREKSMLLAGAHILEEPHPFIHTTRPQICGQQTRAYRHCVERWRWLA